MKTKNKINTNLLQNYKRNQDKISLINDSNRSPWVYNIL